jgi:hypothetical protein
MVRHASWLPAVRAGEWTDAQTGVHSNLRGREGVLTLFPRRGFARALSPRRGPSVRPLRLAPWASGVAPRLIRTARARATIVLEWPKCENTRLLHFLACNLAHEEKLKFLISKR